VVEKPSEHGARRARRGLLLVGQWHLYNHIRLFLLRPGSYVAPVWFPVRGARHLTSSSSPPAASILMELVIGPFDRDATVPSGSYHLHNFAKSQQGKPLLQNIFRKRVVFAPIVHVFLLLFTPV
jgi:hypothetical protein